MATTTFATNDEVKSLHVGLAPKPTEQIDFARSAAFSRIVTALSEGSYAAGAFVASPTSFSTLTLLECRLVALDLLGGGSTSVRTKGGGNSFSDWKATVDQQLALITAGKMNIFNDTLGEFVWGPKFSGPGIISEERNPGVNLEAPRYWPKADPLEEY